MAPPMHTTLVVRTPQPPSTPKRKTTTEAASILPNSPVTPISATLREELRSPAFICIKHRKFEKFQKLPIELRHYIYRLASDRPRVIELRSYMHKPKHGKPQLRMNTDALVPAIMHVSVDARAAGRKIYDPLTLFSFTGTYINWNNDWVVFKGQTENLYMTYEGSLPANVPHFDLVLKLERLAVHHSNINDFVRLRAAKDYEYPHIPSPLLIYPSLRETAVFTHYDDRKGDSINGANQLLLPCTRIPKSTPSFLCAGRPICPFSPENRINEEGVVRVHNRWHQEISWMRAFSGRHRLKTGKSKTTALMSLKEGSGGDAGGSSSGVSSSSLPIQPRKPKKMTGLSKLTVVELRRMAVARGLSDKGNRKTLLAAVAADVEAKFGAAMEVYKSDLKKWAKEMLGFREPGEGEIFGEEVYAAREVAVEKFLAERKLGGI